MSDMNALELHEGQEVGGYTLINRLGSGAMGSVWRVRDGGGEEFAMKVLLDSYSDVEDDHGALSAEERERVTSRERLRREAIALRKIDHPGVCQIVDMELDDSLAFIVTELIDGKNLRDDVAQNGRYMADDLERLAKKLIDAVSAVHAAGIIHRDIKPTNVMVSATGPVLVDFGIAMEPGESHVTRTGLVMGTPGFIAPEIINGEESSEASDWWSLASVLAFAAMGKPAFGVKPMMAVLEREASGNADLAGLPPRIVQAFRAALAPDPAQRSKPEDLLRAITQDAADPRLWGQGGSEKTEAMPPFDVTAAPTSAVATALLPDPVSPRTLWLPQTATDLDSAAGRAAPPDAQTQDPASPGLPVPEQEQVPLDALLSTFISQGGLVAGLLALPVGLLCAAAPAAAVIVAWCLLWMLVATGLSAAADLGRWDRHGRAHTSGDSVLRIASLPWHILKALLLTLPRALILIVIATCISVIGALVLHTPTMMVDREALGLPFSFPLLADSTLSPSALLLAGSAAIAWIAVAFGPGSSMLRLGAGSIRGTALPHDQPAADPARWHRRHVWLWCIWLACTLGAASVLALHGSIDWWPFTLTA